MWDWRKPEPCWLSGGDGEHITQRQSYTYTHTHTHTHTHACTQTHSQTHTLKHTHTYSQTQRKTEILTTSRLTPPDGNGQSPQHKHAETLRQKPCHTAHTDQKNQ